MFKCYCKQGKFNKICHNEASGDQTCPHIMCAEVSKKTGHVIGSYERTSWCKNGDFCTGPAHEKNALFVKDMRRDLFCEKGKSFKSMGINKITCHYASLLLYTILHLIFAHTLVKVFCGGDTLSEGCFTCRKSDGNVGNSWCRGNCYYDEKDRACKERRMC